MSKWMEKIGKRWRRRRARHELRQKARNWKFSNGADCGEQGEGALNTQELINLAKARERIRRLQLKQLAEKKEAQRMRGLERRRV